MTKTFRSKILISSAQVNPLLETHKLFNGAFRETNELAISEFLSRLQSVNRLSPPPANFDPLLGQLVLLGVIAAVESYVRTLFRRVIIMDAISQESVHDQDVPYGAAMHLEKDLLPEAILERKTFLSMDSFKESLKELLAIKGALPPELSTAIEDYVKVCHLRHCAVHRFGKLGTTNAIKLGLGDHRALLEKPLLLDYASLQNMIAIAQSLVKTLNNFVFNELLSRLPKSAWAGNYKADRPLFVAYYDLFADKVSVHGSPLAGKLYREFWKQRSLVN